MSGEIKPVLIDTDVFINHLRGRVQDTQFLYAALFFYTRVVIDLA
ncbi:MAG: hypothetical protein AB1374_12050 [Bacillota bacterium]